MSPKPVAGGLLNGKVWTLAIDDEHRSNLFAGYRLSDATIEDLIDHDVELIVFVDSNRGRYVSTVEDWQDRGVTDGLSEWTHLRQSWMERG